MLWLMGLLPVALLILGFPSNPTAQCVELGFFERIIALARQHDILVQGRGSAANSAVRVPGTAVFMTSTPILMVCLPRTLVMFSWMRQSSQTSEEMPPGPVRPLPR